MIAFAFLPFFIVLLAVLTVVLADILTDKLENKPSTPATKTGGYKNLPAASR